MIGIWTIKGQYYIVFIIVISDIQRMTYVVLMCSFMGIMLGINVRASCAEAKQKQNKMSYILWIELGGL